MNNFYAHCAKCGKFQRKQDMHGLFTPKNKYGPPAILCHLCESCFLQLLDELEVSL